MQQSTVRKRRFPARFGIEEDEEEQHPFETQSRSAMCPPPDPPSCSGQRPGSASSHHDGPRGVPSLQVRSAVNSAMPALASLWTFGVPGEHRFLDAVKARVPGIPAAMPPDEASRALRCAAVDGLSENVAASGGAFQLREASLPASSVDWSQLCTGSPRFTPNQLFPGDQLCSVSDLLAGSPLWTGDWDASQPSIGSGPPPCGAHKLKMPSGSLQPFQEGLLSTESEHCSNPKSPTAKDRQVDGVGLSAPPGTCQLSTSPSLTGVAPKTLGETGEPGREKGEFPPARKLQCSSAARVHPGLAPPSLPHASTGPGSSTMLHAPSSVLSRLKTILENPAPVQKPEVCCITTRKPDKGVPSPASEGQPLPLEVRRDRGNPGLPSENDDVPRTAAAGTNKGEGAPGKYWVQLGPDLWDEGYTFGLDCLDQLDGAAPTSEGCELHEEGVIIALSGSTTDNTDSLPNSGGAGSASDVSPLSARLAATVQALEDREQKQRTVPGAGDGVRGTELVGTKVRRHWLGAASRSSAMEHKLPSQWRGESQASHKAVTAESQGLKYGCRGLAGHATGLAGRGALVGHTDSVPLGVGQGMEVLTKARLIAAATELSEGNMPSFHKFCSQLRPHSKRTGTASQRVVHKMLLLLNLRAKGGGVSFLKRTPRSSYEEVEKSVIWRFSRMPIIPFVVASQVSIILSKMKDKAQVHILCVGDAMKPFLLLLMRLLATQNSSRGSPLKSFRVTHISYYGLLWRHGKTHIKFRDPSRIAEILGKEATSLGLHQEFQAIEVDDTNAEIIRNVSRRPWEATAVCCPHSLRNAADISGSQALTETMKCIRDMEPEVVVLSDEPRSASSSRFLDRFHGSLDYYWGLFHAHDSVLTPETKPIVLVNEHSDTRQSCIVIACEGDDRRVRPRSPSEWRELFALWGFSPTPLTKNVLQASLKAVRSFPPGFELVIDGHNLTLRWKGVPLTFVCTFH